MAAVQPTMQVTVPPGLMEGQAFVIMTPDGQQMQTVVPPGSKAGDVIAVAIPAVVATAVAVPAAGQHPAVAAQAAGVQMQPMPMGPAADPTQTTSGNPKPGCCEPGGCCNPQPPRQQLNYDGTVAILRVPYRDTACCEKSKPFNDQDMATVPSQLVQAGVTEGEWALWTDKLYREVNMLKKPKCTVECVCALTLAVATLFTICPLLCAAAKKETLIWDAAVSCGALSNARRPLPLQPAPPHAPSHRAVRDPISHTLWRGVPLRQFREWQTAFNQQVLMPKNVFCKSQSLCWVTRGPKGEKQRHYHRWIAFAFGPGPERMLWFRMNG